MSLLQKIFKRKKTSSASDLSSPIQSEREDRGLLDSSNSPSTESDVDVDQLTSESERNEKLQQLKSGLRTLQTQNEKLRRRHLEVLALEAEVTHVISLIAMTRRHIVALDEEILDKKCELTFLKSELSNDDTANVKKHEPVYSKRCRTVKNTSDAKQLLADIRERLGIFKMLELMVYNKCLELKHNLSGPVNIKRTATILKNKPHHFGHLTSVIRDRQALPVEKPEAGTISTPHAQTTQGIQCFRMPSHGPLPQSTMTTPPSGHVTSLFPVLFPFLQEHDNNAAVLMPTPPPLPNWETSL